MTPELLAQARDTSVLTGNRILMKIPSVLAAGEEFSLQLSVVDRNGLPNLDFNHSLRFIRNQSVEGLPAEFSFAAGEGTGRIDGLQAVGESPLVIRAELEGASPLDKKAIPVGSSNPAWVFQQPPYRLYWGDLHIHTRYSNCHQWRCLDPRFAYEYAREVSFLDFAAIADHLRGLASEPGRWPEIQQLAREFNLPGDFIAILAFESSHAQGYGGDNNVYYDCDNAPYFWLDRQDMRGSSPTVHLRQLWQQLDELAHPYLSIPHHTGRSNKYRAWNENYYDQRKEPLFEIYSSWGSSEKRWSRLPISGGNNDDCSYYVDALLAGARFGVMAASDDHATLPGSIHHFRGEPLQGPDLNGFAHKGLSAVRSPGLERAALFAAMRNRQTYATTDARSLLEMDIHGSAMGEEITEDSQMMRKRQIKLTCTLDNAQKGQAFLVRNGEELTSQPLTDADDTINRITFEDPEPLDKIAVRGSRFHPEPFVVYYIRIEDIKGYHHWTSPIWIDLP